MIYIDENRQWSYVNNDLVLGAVGDKQVDKKAFKMDRFTADQHDKGDEGCTYCVLFRRVGEKVWYEDPNVKPFSDTDAISLEWTLPDCVFREQMLLDVAVCVKWLDGQEWHSGIGPNFRTVPSSNHIDTLDVPEILPELFSSSGPIGIDENGKQVDYNYIRVMVETSARKYLEDYQSAICKLG